MSNTNKEKIEYDYINQAWTVNDVYQDCYHPKDYACTCYGRVHAGETRERNQ